MNEQLTQELLVFEADHVWVNENLETLLEQYGRLDYRKWSDMPEMKDEQPG